MILYRDGVFNGDLMRSFEIIFLKMYKKIKWYLIDQWRTCRLLFIVIKKVIPRQWISILNSRLYV